MQSGIFTVKVAFNAAESNKCRICNVRHADKTVVSHLYMYAVVELHIFMIILLTSFAVTSQSAFILFVFATVQCLSFTVVIPIQILYCTELMPLQEMQC